jgi:hypothetical protein
MNTNFEPQNMIAVEEVFNAYQYTVQFTLFLYKKDNTEMATDQSINTG